MVLHVKVLQTLPLACPARLRSCAVGAVQGMLLQRGFLVSQTETPSTQSKLRRASELQASLPKLSTVSWYLSKHFRLGLCYCCATGCAFLFQRAKELQLRHFPLKAIQWRGWRGGGALALSIAGMASPAALSALIMCHTLL